MNSLELTRTTKRFEQLSQLAKDVKWHKTPYNPGYGYEGMQIQYTHVADEGQSLSWFIQASHALEGVFKEQSVRKIWDGIVASNEGKHISEVFGQLRDSFEGAVEVIRGGYLTNLSEGIQAETLVELLDQADDHLAQGSLIAAVGIAGGVLETHLRHLVDRHNLTVQGHGSIERYNLLIGQARKAGNEIYPLGDQHQITTWGNARNIADHSPLNFTRSKEEVSLMLQGIRNFLSRVP